jgi:hypothetical protein
MSTLTNSVTEQVQISAVRFEGQRLYLLLSDEREISVPIDKVEWLRWLAQATPEQREGWSIEPGGFAVYWDELDDGIEIQHLLSIEPLA